VHDHLPVQDIHRNQQVANDGPCLVDRQCCIAPVELISKHFLAELEDAVDVLGLALVVLQNVQEPDKLLVVDELSEQADLPHGGVVDPVRHIFEDIRLHRHDETSRSMHTLVHFTVSAFT